MLVRTWMILSFCSIVVLSGCRKEETLQPLSEYESADVQARAYNFQVYPGAKFLEAETALLRRAHFVLQPDATEAPPMAMYETETPLDDVAKFYAEKYGFPRVAENELNNFSSARPAAYFTTGDLAKDTAQVKPILEKLKSTVDTGKAIGPYRGAHISATGNMPRVTLQRPYFNLVRGEVVDRTLIVMVRE